MYGIGPGETPGQSAGSPVRELPIAYDVRTEPDTTATQVSAWANDGSDVVSAEAAPLDLDALRTVIEDHRDIPPQEMPSVQIPPGEYGKGEWAPEDITPDGPPGEVGPGRPERSS